MRFSLGVRGVVETWDTRGQVPHGRSVHRQAASLPAFLCASAPNRHAREGAPPVLPFPEGVALSQWNSQRACVSNTSGTGKIPASRAGFGPLRSRCVGSTHSRPWSRSERPPPAVVRRRTVRGKTPSSGRLPFARITPGRHVPHPREPGAAMGGRRKVGVSDGAGSPPPVRSGDSATGLRGVRNTSAGGGLCTRRVSDARPPVSHDSSSILNYHRGVKPGVALEPSFSQEHLRRTRSTVQHTTR